MKTQYLRAIPLDEVLAAKLVGKTLSNVEAFYAAVGLANVKFTLTTGEQYSIHCKETYVLGNVYNSPISLVRSAPDNGIVIETVKYGFVDIYT